jgi:high-affinity iron transporter
MIAASLLAFREGLEAALILGIVFSVLRRVEQADPARSETTGRMARPVWVGAILAALVSFAAGLGLYAMGIGLEGQAEYVFEGLAMLVAAGVLTWMIFWMDRQGQAIQTELEHNVRQATLGGRWALFSLAFLAVLREGIELALFLTAAAFTATAGATLLGGLIGLGLAVVAGWLLFSTTARLNVRTFFRVTSILLIFFAAGLVAHGVHELNEAGWIPAVVEHIWDLNPVLDEGSAVGLVLKALFGYNGNPSLTEVVAYIGYWVVVLLALRSRRTQTSPTLAQA